MTLKHFKWGTYEDDSSYALELNARMLKFLADSKIEVYSLTLNVSILNEYRDGEKTARDYDGIGSFHIADTDVEKFLNYLNDNYTVLNPKLPEFISIMIHDGDEQEEEFEEDIDYNLQGDESDLDTNI